MPMPALMNDEVHVSRTYLPLHTRGAAFSFSCHFLIKHHNHHVFLLLCDWLTAISGPRRTHLLSGRPVIGCQDQPTLPVYPEARQARKPPLAKQREEATSDSVIPRGFSYCFVIAGGPFLTLSAPHVLRSASQGLSASFGPRSVWI